MSNKFNVGDKVHHEIFGKGFVDHLNMSGLAIKFDTYRNIMCVPAYDLTSAVLVDIIKKITSLKRTHYVCDDCWYSCPLSTDGCCNDSEEDVCNCGADEHNAKIDTIIIELKEWEKNNGRA